MTALQLFIVAALAHCLFWRSIDALYPDPSVGFWWCVPAGLLGGLMVLGFRALYRRTR